ncbi:CaiB/BaiF CoA transferase family protein [Neorhizobium sp. DAR64861/K0K2]|uniref:CaiB/BaiF CoA transferase family protein n=1 Tax=unclassified Neorhizobium TaxID=2629175 RepID=UPI003D2DFAD4
MSGRELPLVGIKVIEFCQVAAGPFCAMLLADFGADVIKIENVAGGDGMRKWPPINNGYSENFASLNRNKRSLALDLKSPEGKEIALKLCSEADVVVENNRPGVMDRLGLGYSQLSQINPALVYASISGFGQTGPRAFEGGFDVTIQAMAGVISVTGEEGGGPVKCGVPISDFSTGLYAAFSISSALRQAGIDGKGRFIDISLLGATLGVAALQTSEYFGTGDSPRKMGAAHPRNAPYEAFKSGDGHFVMAAGNDKLWRSVCEIVGQGDLLLDPRFATNSDRAIHQVELRILLEQVFATGSSAEWLEKFRAAGVPCAPINDYAAALSDPQVEAMGWIQNIDLPGGVTARTFGSPVRLDGETLKIRQNPPALGEHNAEIIASLEPAMQPKEKVA